MAPAELSTLSTFLYGCLGGAIAFVAVFALPELREIYKTTGAQIPPPSKLIVAGLILVALVILGGAAAVLLGDATQAKQAIAYGVAGEGLVGGIIRGATSGSTGGGP